MTKKAPAPKKSAKRRPATSPRKAVSHRAAARPRKAEVCQAPAESAAVATVETAPAPAPAAKKPEPRVLPVDLARMLEEETWWRVVRVQSVEPTVRIIKAKAPKSAARLPISKVRHSPAHRKAHQR